jgi:hypothetical protein
MAKKISGSVGKGGKNNSDDTRTVQELLNAFSKKCGFKKLGTDGMIGPKTISAISTFQRKAVGMSRADSRIDPRGDSFEMLAAGPKKAAKANGDKTARGNRGGKQDKQEDNTEGRGQQAAATGNGKPQVKGDKRGVDKRILGVLEAVSAHYGKPILIESGKQEDSAGGEQLWREWTNSLKRGKRDPNLKRNDRLREQLNTHYCQLQQEEFLALVAENSRKLKSGGSAAHAAGRAVDLNRNTDSKVVAALATILRREDEGSVIHFDDTGKSIPKTITEAMKRKWK